MTKGSLSRWQIEPRELLTGSLTGGVADAERAKSLSSLDDLAEPSSGEKAVRRVSGVPLKESAPPLEDRGEDGLKWLSRVCAMMNERWDFRNW